MFDLDKIAELLFYAASDNNRKLYVWSGDLMGESLYICHVFYFLFFNIHVFQGSGFNQDLISSLAKKTASFVKKKTTTHFYKE